MKQPILACIDLTEVDAAVLDAAAELATALSAGVMILHVTQPDPDFVGFEAGPQSVRDQWADKYRQQHRKLQQHVEQLTGLGLQADALVVQGAAAEAITEHAESLDARLIILGSRGHGKVHDLLLGSVPATVTRQSRRRILLIPPVH